MSKKNKNKKKNNKKNCFTNNAKLTPTETKGEIPWEILRERFVCCNPDAESCVDRDGDVEDVEGAETVTATTPIETPKPLGYTPQGDHPEDRIFRDKEFINKLSEVQNKYFDELVADLSLSQEGSDLLFDYVYNEDHSLCFDEWLLKLGRNYHTLVQKSK